LGIPLRAWPACLTVHLDHPGDSLPLPQPGFPGNGARAKKGGRFGVSRALRFGPRIAAMNHAFPRTHGCFILGWGNFGPKRGWARAKGKDERRDSFLSRCCVKRAAGNPQCWLRLGIRHRAFQWGAGLGRKFAQIVRRAGGHGIKTARISKTRLRMGLAR